MKVLLNVFSKSPSLCVLTSEIHVLVTTSKAFNSKGNKEYPGKALHCGLG